MKAIILARVSTKEQEEKDHSNPAQVRRLKEYVQKKQLTELTTFEIAESSTQDTRKKFEQVLTLIKNSTEIVALVVETVDRLQRSFKESVVLDDLRKAGKVELHFVRENLVLSKDANSSQLLQWDMAVMFARSYVLQLSDNVKRSIEQKLKKGEVIGRAPLGYLNIRDDNDESNVVVDPQRGHLIIKMFELYASGQYSVKLLAKEMERLGLRSLTGKPLSTSNIEYYLKNPFYYGQNKVKGKLYPHKFEPLISYNLFLKVQEVFTSWNKKPFQYAARPFIFRGLITCANCGCTITPELKKGKYTYYSCTNYKGKCQRIWVNETELLKPIYEVLGAMQIPQDKLDFLTAQLRKNNETKTVYHKHALEELNRQYQLLQNRIDRLMDLLLDSSITKEDYDKKFKELKEKQQDIVLQIEEHTEADESYYITASTVLNLAKRALEIFESSQITEKRQLLNFLLQNCRLEGKKLMFTIRNPFGAIVTATENQSWLG